MTTYLPLSTHNTFKNKKSAIDAYHSKFKVSKSNGSGPDMSKTLCNIIICLF